MKSNVIKNVITLKLLIIYFRREKWTNVFLRDISFVEKGLIEFEAECSIRAWNSRWEDRVSPPPSLPPAPASYLSFFLSSRCLSSRRRYNRFSWCSPAFWEKIEPVCKTKKALPAIQERSPVSVLYISLLILPPFYPRRGRDSWELKRFRARASRHWNLMSSRRKSRCCNFNRDQK